MQPEVSLAPYEQDGLLVVPGLIDPGLVGSVRAEVEALWDRSARGSDRAQDLWLRSNAVRALAAHGGVARLLVELYGRRAIPFQTLNFRHGTAQPLHADAIHFDTVPSGWMCGVWVALENVDVDQGPLRWVAGSHRGRPADVERFGSAGEGFDDATYEADVRRQVDDNGWQTSDLPVQVGDAIVWSAHVLHGGAPVDDPASTRWSQVTHYVFEGFPAVTPQASVPSEGRWALRDPLVNITTGAVEPLVDEHGRRVAALPAGRGLYRLGRESILPPSQRRRARAGHVLRRMRALPRRARLGLPPRGRRQEFATRLQ